MKAKAIRIFIKKLLWVNSYIKKIFLSKRGVKQELWKENYENIR